MKITAVLGSPRDASVSTRIAMRLIEGARDAGHKVKIHKINEMDILGCHGCGCCRKYDTDCVIEDDMEEYFKDLRESEALILTSPNYYSHVAGPMITFMNRHYCLLDKDKNPRLPREIKLVCVFAQGAPAGYEKYLPNYDWYISTFTAKNMELAGQIIAGGDSDVSEEGEIMTKAYALGKSL